MPFETDDSFQFLRKAISERPKDFVAIIGAGVSAQSGLPIWGDLIELLITDAEKHMTDLLEQGIDEPVKYDFKKLRADQDNWRRIGQIRNALGQAKFEARIKYHLRYSNPPSPSNILLLIWKLGIKGIVTPNLDPLAKDAFAKVFGRAPDVSSANENKYREFLGDERNFVFHPHGELSDPKSWVLTTDKLADLLKNDSYQKWWENLLDSRHLIFLGVNESDVSIRSYILKNSTCRDHFVIAPYDAKERMPLYQELGYLFIPYQKIIRAGKQEDHSELNELIENIVNYKSLEISPPSAYSGESMSPKDLPSPSELQKMPIDKVREMLNSAVASILPIKEDAEGKSLEEFDSVRKKYLFSFMGASAVEPDTEYARVHEYRALSRIGDGGFGSVYIAERIKDKKKYALKVIHPQIIQSGPHLNAFRRGAYAMKILTERKIDGIVKYENAYEVPFSIVMEYVDGYDLEKAIEHGRLPDICDRLRIVKRVAQIVHSAHCVEEQVLHRDIKPGNILLSGYSYDDMNVAEVVKVVDFDLCWHRYATAKTVVHHKGSQGYAAPEIFDPTLGSTRKFWVDVYGLGMLLYYVLSEKHPVPGITAGEAFIKDFSYEISHHWKFRWNSLSWHFSRMVKIATSLHPQNRPSIPDFIEMLDIAIAFHSDLQASNYLPLIGMELIHPIKEDASIIQKNYGRKIILTKYQKELVLILEGKSLGILVNVNIRLSKDKDLRGDEQSKRDHKVGAKIIQLCNQNGIKIKYDADASKREAILEINLSNAKYATIEKTQEIISSIWLQISHYV